MHKSITAAAAMAALAITSSASLAQAEESAWAYFEPEGGPMQAGVVSANGGQLIFKCDETGDNTVYAVIFSPSRIAPPSQRPPSRDVRLQFDDTPPRTMIWPYYEQTVVALNTRRAPHLAPFLEFLADANTLRVDLDPVDGGPIRIDFTVTGSREAVRRVYESCQDSSNPLG